MTEDMARALGADGTTTVEIAGKQCTARPLGVGELTEVERLCVEQYRRSYLKTYADNADLLPNGKQLLEQKMEEAARWDVDDLPAKQAYDSSSIKLTDELKEWIKNEFDLDGEQDEVKMRRLCAAALDQESLTEKQYRKMSGARPRTFKVPYVNWWMTASFDGMITFIWVCFKYNDVTRQQVADMLSKDPALMATLSREIESLSAARVGNG